MTVSSPLRRTRYFPLFQLLRQQVGALRQLRRQTHIVGVFGILRLLQTVDRSRCTLAVGSRVAPSALRRTAQRSASLKLVRPILYIAAPPRARGSPESADARVVRVRPGRRLQVRVGGRLAAPAARAGGLVAGAGAGFAGAGGSGSAGGRGSERVGIHRLRRGKLHFGLRNGERLGRRAGVAGCGAAGGAAAAGALPLNKQPASGIARTATRTIFSASHVGLVSHGYRQADHKGGAFPRFAAEVDCTIV